MKILKGFAALVLIVIVVFAIAGLFGPKSFHMERSVVIHAPAHTVFTYISDYTRWQQWSPWVGIDTACKYEYYGPQGQADAGYKWSGNAKVGEGEMHTTELAQDISLVSHLSFFKPWKSESVASFKLDSASPGDTKVTWSYDQNFPFSQRPMMLVMNMEKMLSPDYEKGLANLKRVAEAAPAASAPAVKEVKWEKKTYIGYRTTASFASVSDLFQKQMPAVFTYLKDNKLEMAGAPSGLYFTWDTAKKTTDMAVAIPVAKADKVSGGYQIITVEASNAVTADYYGPYDKMEGVHALLNQYITDKGFKKKPPVIEEYVGDPGSEKDPNKVLTKVYYLID